MARLTWECIAPKDENGDIIKDWKVHCDKCGNKILIGEIYLCVRDGFGYNYCINCYIKELEDEILDIEWIKKKNEKIKIKIDRLKRRI